MPSREQPKVGYVVKRYPRYSETFIVNEILAQEAAGLDIEIFALRGPEDTHFQDIISRVRAPVTYLPDKLQKTSDFWSVLQAVARRFPDQWQTIGRFADTEPREIAHGAALAQLTMERGISHLHAHFATSATTAARIASHISGIPYTFTAHAKDIFHDSVDRADLAGKIADAKAVVTVSDFNMAYLNKHFPDSARKVHRIYNGLDLQRFRFADARERTPTIVAVGRLVEKKGFEYLIEACALMRDAGLSFDCKIVGTGEREQDLLSLINERSLQGCVRILGARPQREVMEIVQSSAVMAAPCVVGADGNRDGLPTVVLEAMALGTPCVGTDVTGMPEALVEGRTGRCIAQRDVEGLAAALRELMIDAALRDRLAKGARRHIESLFDVHRNAAMIRGLFLNNDVLAQGTYG